jgi:hypothetical protein
VIRDSGCSPFGFNLDVIGIEADNPLPSNAAHVTRGASVDIADLHIDKPVLRVMIETEKNLPAFPHAVFPGRLRPLKITLLFMNGEKEGVLSPAYHNSSYGSEYG